MKRILAGILTVLLLITVSAGCTPRVTDLGGDPAPTGQPTAAPTEGPTGPTAPPEPSEGEAAPLMWRATGEETGTLYLFGTIHVGDASMTRVVDRAEAVLAACDALAVEFDIVAYGKDAVRSARDLQQFVYSNGDTVRKHMPEKVYKGASALLKRAGMSTSSLDVFSPAMWSMLVDEAAVQLYSRLQSPYGADGLLIRRAYGLDIPVWDLESAAMQYELMNSFSDEVYSLIIRQTLQLGEEYGTQLDALYKAWLEGDLNALTEQVEGDEGGELTEEQISLVTAYNEAMLDQRNLRMAEKAKEYLEDGKTVFFAVGAAHLLGDAGVVQLLRDAGYSVELYSY